jgi:acetyl esterase/lipase
MNRRSETAGQPDQTHVLMRSARPPDLTLRYGDQADHIADVHLPPPAVSSAEGIGGRKFFTLFIHGGFWKPEYDRAHTAPLAEALAAAGFVVCAPEYRRSAKVGGGWPGTFDDIAAAVDKLPSLVADATNGLVDPAQVVLAGHSAGGHLALWAASRHQLPAGSPWRRDRRTGYGVVALAAVSDLAACSRLGLGQGAADAFMGGGPGRHPDRYAVADPAVLLPVRERVRLVHGLADDLVPPSLTTEYADRARAAGDSGVECVLLPDAGHFELIDPLSAAWPTVEAAFRSVQPPVLRADS